MISDKAAKFWYRVFWIAVIATVLWIIAKVLGIIQTPLIYEIFPIASGIIALIGIGITLGNYFQKTNFIFDQIHKIESRQDRMAQGLINVEKDVVIIKKDIDVVKKDINVIKKDTNIMKEDIKEIKER